MGRRFPVRTPIKGGVSPYKALRPKDGKTWTDRFFTSTDVDLRGALNAGAWGVLLFRRTHGVEANAPGETIMIAQNTLKGLVMRRQSPSNLSGLQYLLAQVGTSPSDVKTAYEEGWGMREALGIAVSGNAPGPVFGGTNRPNVSGALEMATVVVDDDPYPVEGFNINGRNHNNRLHSLGINCVAVASLSDGDYFSLKDGWSHSTFQDFEYDVTGNGVTSGRIPIDVSNATTAQDVAQLTVMAINASGMQLYAQVQAVGGTQVRVVTTMHGGKTGRVGGSNPYPEATENVADSGFTFDLPQFFNHDGLFESWNIDQAVTNFFLMVNDASGQAPSLDYLAGMFFHEEPLTEDELFFLRQEVEIHKKIPDVPTLSGSPTLDHIWDVSSDFESGTFALSGNWISRGAVGGKILSPSGAGANSDLEVIELDARFSLR